MKLKFIFVAFAALLYQDGQALPVFQPAGNFEATMKCSRCLRNGNTFCTRKRVWWKQIDVSAANSDTDNPKDDYRDTATGGHSVCCNPAVPNAACTSTYTAETGAATEIWCSSDFATVDKALLACPIEIKGFNSAGVAVAKCNTHSTDAPTMLNKNPPVHRVLGKVVETKTWEIQGLTKEDHCKIIIKA